MNTLRTLYHLMRADFLERIRRYSFLIILGLTIFAGYAFVPPIDANYVTLDLGGYRGVYNSAWIGSMVALLTAIFFSLAGFYLVKGAVDRDRQSGVGQIIATTPISKSLYTLGKWLSNFAVLAVMVGVIAVAAGAMQLIRGEELRIDPWALLSPFLLVTLPAMALVAALAVLFETISWLRGGFGNVVYFFLWIALIGLSFSESSAGGQTAFTPMKDMPGIAVLLSSMAAAAKGVFPDYNGGGRLGFSPLKGELQTFRWEGVQWTLGIILGRLLWIGVALGIALIAALFFHRFDPAREKQKRARHVTTPSVVREAKAVVTSPMLVHLTPLVSGSMRFRFGPLLLVELRLMLKGLRWWWYAVAVGLIIASLNSPVDVARQRLLPAAWIWPLLIWSAMGTREVRHRTEQIVFPAAHPLRRQLPATWLAGVIVALLAGSGVAVRLVLAGDWASMMAWIVGASFIPSLALALGCWSGSSKLFEVVYTLLWYIGPVNQVPTLDFMGASTDSIAAGTPLIYLICTMVLFGLAVLGRHRQIQI